MTRQEANPPGAEATSTTLQREMTSVGGGLFTAGGLLILVVLLFGRWEGIQRPALTVACVVAIAAGIGLLLAARVHPLSARMLAGMAVLGTANVTATIIAAGPDGAAAFGVLYVFVVGYSFYYFTFRLALAEVVLAALAHAVGLQFVLVADPISQWLVMTGATVIIGSLIGRGGKRVRDLLVIERDAMVRLRELDQLRASFLRAVSHELRTPLTVVVGIAETLRDRRHQLDELQLDELIGRIASNSERLQQLLVNLLDIDRISRGVVQAIRTPTDMGILARRMVDEAEVGSRLVDVLVVGDTVIDIEASKVERIVENLLNNAVRHTPDGTPVRVTVEGSASAVVLTVEDDGPGVHDDLRASLFEPFIQGRSAADSPRPGTGIGLALVQQFAELHGGSATVTTASSGGARFEVHLPRLEQQVPGDDARADLAARG